MSPIIRVEHLSKRYRLGQTLSSGGYQRFSESLVHWAKSPLRWLRHGKPKTEHEHTPPQDFWALNDVSFEVQPGEVVGIIGRNGAGKSTLLKILSRITEPTSGRITLNGRVASLLEVGTGFHPELTGRENIYLNGAILGMTKAEIKSKFDEIVAFAEVERFLDTPVKRYSSGMYVRLAFAVAAHLEPEILIVDEVLAVGDAQFQKKCLGKMQDVAKGGRTVLFVSHNIVAIQNLCSRGILIERGQIVHSGLPSDVLATYVHQTNHFTENTNRTASHLICGFRILNQHQPDASHTVIPNAPIIFEIDLALGEQPVAVPIIGLGINNEEGIRVTTLGSHLSTSPLHQLKGNCTVKCVAPHLPLLPGTYSLKVALNDNLEQLDVVDGHYSFRVCESDYFGNGSSLRKDQGLFFASSEWEVVPRRTDS